MDNKTFGIAFSAILSSALFVFGAANAGAYAVDKWVFPTASYGERTYIGTTDVSNMEIETAKTLFSGQVASWRETSELFVTYQDVTASYPLESAEILLEETVHQAESGNKNGFVYQLSPRTTQDFLEQNFPTATFLNADIEAVNTKLEQTLGAGKMETRVSIGDDSLMVAKETVAELSFPQTFETRGAQQIISELNGLQIAPNSQFSFLQILEQLTPSDVTDAELTEIASALYGLVIRTNMHVDERSIGTIVPTSTPVGQEAAINRSLGIDFKFTNPNASSFILDWNTSDNSLYASFIGLPLVHTYEIQNGTEQWVDPRLIKQYSAFVSSGSMVKEEGSEGVRLQVSRIINANNVEIAVEPVSTDFYPPVHRVEVHALTVAESETTTDENGITVDENGNPVDEDGNPVDDSDIVVDENGNSVDESGNLVDENGNFVDPAIPTLPFNPSNPYDPTNPYDPSNPSSPYDPGNPDGPTNPVGNGQDNPSAEKEPVYDKSGKVINP